VQEQATIQASLESSWQIANEHVDLSGEVDLGDSSPSDDDPDVLDYKPSARACHTKPPEDSVSETKILARCPVASQSFDSLETMSSRCSTEMDLPPSAIPPVASLPQS